MHEMLFQKLVMRVNLELVETDIVLNTFFFALF